MADEYIKRKDVLECIKESRDGIDWGQSEDGDAFLHYSACLYRTIASNECFPSADVEEVKRGRWIKTVGENGVTSACRCSNCGFGDNRYSLFKYCPICGADMRMDGGT